MPKDNQQIIEKLYDEKSFIVPNGGDIQKVEITYSDWIWLENFILKALISQKSELKAQWRKEIGKLGNSKVHTKHCGFIAEKEKSKKCSCYNQALEDILKKL